MKSFIHEDFLLQTDAAKQLYHEHAKQPIMTMLPSGPDTSRDHAFNNLEQIWLRATITEWRVRTTG